MNIPLFCVLMLLNFQQLSPFQYSQKSLQHVEIYTLMAMSEPSATSLEYYSEVMREVDDMQSNDIDLAEFGVSDSADADQIMVH